MIKLHSCIGALVFASCVGPVSAQVTWNLTGGAFNNASETSSTGATDYYAGKGNVGGITLNLSAYANTANNVPPTGQSASTAINDQMVEQQIGGYQSSVGLRIGINDYGSGVGIVNVDGCGFSYTPSRVAQTATCDTAEGSAPGGALDNDQRYEMILLSFGAKVSLTALNLGYVNTDSDMTIMAYTGGGNALTDLQSGLKTWSDFGAGGTSATTAGTLGWKALANFDGDTSQGASAGNRIIVSNGIASSYWLIGAYNPLANPNGGTLNGFDYMKVASVSGNVVPEPGSLALLAAALLGMVAVRQRKKA